METKLTSRLLTASLLLLPALIFGQEWKKISSTKISLPPTAFSVDIQHNFYLGFSDGRVTKYNQLGEELQTFSLSNQAPISLIEAQNSLKLFVFNFDNQKITFLDRFTAQPRTYFLTDYGASLGMMTCPSPEGNAWVAENNPRRLKKIDLLRQFTLLEVQTSLGDSIKFMRTQQNLLLIADENGVHVFDQFGSKEHFLKAKNINYIQAIDNQILFSSFDGITLFDPYSGKISSKYTSPVNDIRVAIKLDQSYLIIGQSIELYQLQK